MNKQPAKHGVEFSHTSNPFSVRATQVVATHYVIDVFDVLENLSDVEDAIYVMSIAEEQDTITLNLNCDGGSAHESVKGSLGARLTRTLIETMGDFRANVQVRGRWVHEFGDDRANVDTAFSSNPGIVFNVEDGKVARDSAVLGAGLTGDLNKSTRVYLDYDTRLSSDETVHIIGVSLQYRW